MAIKNTKKFRLTIVEVQAINDFFNQPIFNIDYEQATFSIGNYHMFRQNLARYLKQANQGDVSKS
ncbi:hypothetical protein [Leuconostoc citreum]